MSRLPGYKTDPSDTFIITVKMHMFCSRISTHFNRLQPFCTDVHLINIVFIQMLCMVETRLHSNSNNLKLHYARGACWFTIATSRWIAMTQLFFLGSIRLLQTIIFAQKLEPVESSNREQEKLTPHTLRDKLAF